GRAGVGAWGLPLGTQPLSPVGPPTAPAAPGTAAPPTPAPVAPVAPPYGTPPAPATGMPTPAPLGSQAEATPVMPPPAALAPPPSLRLFPVPAQTIGRELTLAEAVHIGLDNATKITAAHGDYLASRQRVYEVMSPLLPQISGQWNGFQNQVVSVTSGALNPGAQFLPQRTVTQQVLTTTATVTGSQLLFDFGETWA